MSSYLPHGLSKSDLIHIGELPDIDDKCPYFSKWGDHDWKCCDCSRGYGLDPTRPPMWPKKKINHRFCQDKDKTCESCNLIETEEGDIIEPDISE